MVTESRVVLIGGGGHCRACIDVIEQASPWTIAGIVDLPERVGGTVLGYPVIGSDNDLKQILGQTKSFIVTIGQVDGGNRRNQLYDKALGHGGQPVTIVSPLAYVSSRSVIGAGSVVMHHVLINSGATVGRNCIINSKSPSASTSAES